MMRPVTTICMLMAAGSGLYLYQAKHQAQLETREIARILSEVDTVRQRIGVLATEYQLENDPERLGDLAGRFLPQLKPTQPPQFTVISELDKRLPPVGAPPQTDAAPLEQNGPDLPVAGAGTPIARADTSRDDGKAEAAKSGAAVPAVKPSISTQMASRTAPAQGPQPGPRSAPPRVAAAADPGGWTSTAPAARRGGYPGNLTTPVASPVFANNGSNLTSRGFGTPSSPPAQVGSSLGMARFIWRAPDGGPPMASGGGSGG
jgi:hypothetical protein